MTTPTRPAGARGEARPAGRPLTFGSMCTGYGGLDMAVSAVLDIEPAWVADPDPGAAAILAHHWPNVPNLGDITAVDWTTVPPIDVLCAGYPCQPFSHAGKRKGTADERHLWPHIAIALRVLRPRLAIFENVANHLRLGFADVLADLADLGFDAEWCLASASEVGAPHQRRRLFLLAWPADAPRSRLEGARLRGRLAGRGGAAADTDHLGDDRPAAEHGPDGRTVAARDAAAHTDRGPVRQQSVPVAGSDGPAVAEQHRTSAADAEGHEQREPAITGPLRPEPRHGAPSPEWGEYAPAIERWARVLGRPAPHPTEPGRDGRPRLSPALVEWLMGLPEGHVTAVPGLTRNTQLKALGNGVVPAQGAAALSILLDRMEAA